MTIFPLSVVNATLLLLFDKFFSKRESSETVRTSTHTHNTDTPPLNERCKKLSNVDVYFPAMLNSYLRQEIRQQAMERATRDSSKKKKCEHKIANKNGRLTDEEETHRKVFYSIIEWFSSDCYSAGPFLILLISWEIFFGIICTQIGCAFAKWYTMLRHHFGCWNDDTTRLRRANKHAQEL